MKRRDALITIIVLLLLILFGLLFATTRGNQPSKGLSLPTPAPQPSAMTAVYGIVTDTSGNPLAGVTVIVGGIGSTSKEDGSYMVLAAIEGDQLVRFKDLKGAASYRPTNRSRLSVIPGQSVEKNFTLEVVEKPSDVD